MKKKQLNTFQAVVDELGGIAPTALLVGQNAAAVCNWKRRRSRFPTKFYFVMIEALAELGSTAPLDLWGFYKPKIKKTKKKTKPGTRKRANSADIIKLLQHRPRGLVSIRKALGPDRNTNVGTVLRQMQEQGVIKRRSGNYSLAPQRAAQ